MSAKHILVVECNAEEATSIRKALKGLPFCTSFLCRSLGEARAYLAGAGIYKDRENYPTPDAIVTEFRLGGDSAYELIVWIRGHASSARIPIYVLARELSANDEKMLSMLNLKAIIRKESDSGAFAEQLRRLADQVCGA